MTDSAPAPASGSTPFHDLDGYVDLPRGAGLTLSPDGTRLVTAVQTLNPKRTKWVTALWEVDPAGERPARRLTRSAKGEGGAAFLPDGSLLFTSARPGPGRRGRRGGVAALAAARRWRRGPGRGAAGPAGSTTSRSHPDAGTVVLASKTFPSSDSHDAEAAKRKERKEKKVSAILHEQVPVRFWDHDLGPDAPRLFAGTLADAEGPGDEPKLDLTDLTPEPGRALVEGEYDVSPDGSTVATTWALRERGGLRYALALIDVASGDLTIALDDVGERVRRPELQPRRPVDRAGPRGALHAARPGRPAAVPSTPATTGRSATSPATGTTGPRARWSGPPTARRSCSSADEDGRAPVFRLDVASGEFTRLTADAFTYSDVQVSPDGRHVYAMRTSYAEPFRPVRLDATTPDQDSEPLPRPERDARAARPARGGRDHGRATAPACARGWRCPTTPRRRARPRCCCGSTAARSGRGTRGRGAGTRGWPSRRGTPCCCPTRRCPPATGWSSSAAAGATGATRRTPT